MLKLFLLLSFAFVFVTSQDKNPNPQQPPSYNEQEKQQHSEENVQNLRLAQRPECRADVERYCIKHMALLQPNEVLNDTTTLECLQDAAYDEATQLQQSCALLVWQYKIVITQDPGFIQAATHHCSAEFQKNTKLKECMLDTRPGYALSCMMDYAHQIEQNTDCFYFLEQMQRLAFSDFQLVAPFVEFCGRTIYDLGCGTLTKPSAHKKVRVPHSQGSTLQCLVEKIVNVPKDPKQKEIIEKMPKECRKEATRIVELQSDDFHLDRPLFFACRKDREQFCGEIQAGEGRIFQCLMSHKENKDMEPSCAKMLSERAGMMGQDYRLAHSLTKACGNEMSAYQCIPQEGFEKLLNFYLSWVVLCLENGMHHYNQQQAERQQLEKEGKKPLQQHPQLLPFNEECQHELYTYRQMMMQEFRMSPELVMSCAQEISEFCGLNHDIENEGKTLHCLMGHAQERDDKNKLSTQCRNALDTVVKLADIGTNYKVDKVLYSACRPLIEGICKMDMVSEASTLSCLMRNLDGSDVLDECEKRLLEVQYFLVRDWTLDPALYNACHTEAVERCSAIENWNVNGRNDGGNVDNKVDPGPQVLACLFRAGYDTEKPLGTECTKEVQRVLKERAVRVKLMPEIEENCREALTEFCSLNIRPSEELECLQDHFESKQFQQHYSRCYKAVFDFTKLESKSTKLNRLLTRACRPVIDTYCSQFADEEIDHGDVMECLENHKDAKEMNPKCRSYVHHFELISLRDYHFSYRFNEACQADIQQYCSAFGQKKGDIIRCLSDIMFEHRVLNDPKDLHKECKKQLRVAYLQQEQVNFDDPKHMGDADPELTQKCDADLKRLGCMKRQSFDEVVECLRVDFDSLDPSCKAIVFSREKIEAFDNTFDNELQRACKYDISHFCNGQEGDRVLNCLMNTKIVRLLQKDCQKVVQERMLERVRDDRLNPSLLMACQMDAEQYCPEDYRKINDPRYEKQQLGAIIASCLRTKFAQFSGGVRLTAQCKDEVSRVILESEFDIQLDPALYKACRAIINRHCSTSILSRGGNFDNVLECLKADFYTGQISDADCARQLARRTQESLVDIHLDPSLHEACSLDVQRICKDTPPGQSRIIMCLLDALQVQQIHISQSCRTKLTERQRLWNVAHDKYMMALPATWSELYVAIATHPARSSILSWLGFGFLVLLLIGCCVGRLTKRTYNELKNR